MPPRVPRKLTVELPEELRQSLDDWLSLHQLTIERVDGALKVMPSGKPRTPAGPVGELVGCLAARRKLLGMTQTQVAVKCHVSQPAISRLEDGRVEPSLRLLLDYAHAVRMELAWTLRGLVLDVR